MIRLDCDGDFVQSWELRDLVLLVSGGGAALMNLIMNSADLGKSEIMNLWRMKKSENNEFGTSLESLKIMNALVQKWPIFQLFGT